MWLFIEANQIIYAEKTERCVGFMRQAQKDGDALLTVRQMFPT